jgi:beta-1,4-N-acetylglucosaminyltransferase
MTGGHTSEMLQLLKGLDLQRYGPRKYILSAGDHLSAKKAAEFESEQSSPSVSSFGFLVFVLTCFLSHIQ